MIAYEELEKALVRWKARRAGGAEPAEPVREAGDVPTGPAVILSEGYQAPDNTGELDLADAEVTDA